MISSGYLSYVDIAVIVRDQSPVFVQLQLHIQFLAGDAAAVLASEALREKKFDFIDTSNLSDHMSLLAVLLLCQPHLKW